MRGSATWWLATHDPPSAKATAFTLGRPSRSSLVMSRSHADEWRGTRSLTKARDSRPFMVFRHDSFDCM